MNAMKTKSFIVRTMPQMCLVANAPDAIGPKVSHRPVLHKGLTRCRLGPLVDFT
jgi:hypothetical protein